MTEQPSPHSPPPNLNSEPTLPSLIEIIKTLIQQPEEQQELYRCRRLQILKEYADIDDPNNESLVSKSAKGDQDVAGFCQFRLLELLHQKSARLYEEESGEVLSHRREDSQDIKKEEEKTELQTLFLRLLHTEDEMKSVVLNMVDEFKLIHVDWMNQEFADSVIDFDFITWHNFVAQHYSLRPSKSQSPKRRRTSKSRRPTWSSSEPFHPIGSSFESVRPTSPRSERSTSHRNSESPRSTGAGSHKSECASHPTDSDTPSSQPSSPTSSDWSLSSSSSDSVVTTPSFLAAFIYSLWSSLRWLYQWIVYTWESSLLRYFFGGIVTWIAKWILIFLILGSSLQFLWHAARWTFLSCVRYLFWCLLGDKFLSFWDYGYNKFIWIIKNELHAKLHKVWTKFPLVKWTFFPSLTSPIRDVTEYIPSISTTQISSVVNATIRLSRISEETLPIYAVLGKVHTLLLGASHTCSVANFTTKDELAQAFDEILPNIRLLRQEMDIYDAKVSSMTITVDVALKFAKSHLDEAVRNIKPVSSQFIPPWTLSLLHYLMLVISLISLLTIPRDIRRISKYRIGSYIAIFFTILSTTCHLHLTARTTPLCQNVQLFYCNINPSHLPPRGNTLASALKKLYTTTNARITPLLDLAERGLERSITISDSFATISLLLAQTSEDVTVQKLHLEVAASEPGPLLHRLLYAIFGNAFSPTSNSASSAAHYDTYAHGGKKGLDPGQKRLLASLERKMVHLEAVQTNKISAMGSFEVAVEILRGMMANTEGIKAGVQKWENWEENIKDSYSYASAWQDGNGNEGGGGGLYRIFMGLLLLDRPRLMASSDYGGHRTYTSEVYEQNMVEQMEFLVVQIRQLKKKVKVGFAGERQRRYDAVREFERCYDINGEKGKKMGGEAVRALWERCKREYAEREGL